MPAQLAKPRRLKSQNVVREIFRSPSPEEATKSLPAQTLFLGIRSQGLHSSSDLITLLTREQTQVLLDLDCWERDRFEEKQFWEWLQLGDEDDGLVLQQKILSAVDLKVIGLLVDRHVESICFEEPTDAPPGPGFSSPDEGTTWLRVTLENENHHFLFTRFLALLYETDADVFYQLLALPRASTAALLEEEAYLDRSRRLTSQGIPSHDLAEELHAPLMPFEVKRLIEKEGGLLAEPERVPAVEPLIYQEELTPLLSQLIAEVSNEEGFEAEFTLVANGAIVFFDFPLNDQDDLILLSSLVKGVLEIGIASSLELTGRGIAEAYHALHLKGFYRHGLWHLSQLRSQALRVPLPRPGGNLKNDSSALANETTLEKRSVSEEILLNCLRKPIPLLPIWWGNGDNTQTDLEKEKDTELRAINSLEELRAVSAFLESLPLTAH